MRLTKLLIIVCSFFLSTNALAEKITVAAAADLKFAMDEIVTGFNKNHSDVVVEVIYGSSGKFFTQIQQGAPFDLYFSADIAYPRALAKKGLAASDVTPYAVGRIVLWSNSMDTTHMTLASLADPRITKIAIANPKHAPYGKRAEEALRAGKMWDTVQSKLVFGENIAHTAQFVQTGNAQIGIIALSLVLNPELSKKGGYYLIPDTLHLPLEQAYIITKHGADKLLAKQFAQYMTSKETRRIMTRYGFVLPGEK
ncbi:MAG: molybdate ABC transporter substrate-binding protein [Desulfuromonadaceae bacterium]|nr:molybdate ABC transporter substrate-binding protein [Desulfuromonadaceae bacterium]